MSKKKCPRPWCVAGHCKCCMLHRRGKGIKRDDCALSFIYLFIYIFIWLLLYISCAGCPLVSCKQELANEIALLDQADREVICGTLFHTVNWFREVHVSICCARCLNKISSELFVWPKCNFHYDVQLFQVENPSWFLGCECICNPRRPWNKGKEYC